MIATDAYHQLDLIRGKLLDIAQGESASEAQRIRALQVASDVIERQVGIFSRLIPKRHQHDHDHRVTTHSAESLLDEANRLMKRRDAEIGVKDVTSKTETHTETRQSRKPTQKTHGKEIPKTPEAETV